MSLVHMLRHEARLCLGLCAVLCAGLLTSIPGVSQAFRLIGAPATDGSYCLYPVLDCDDDDTFARWFIFDIPFWVNEDAADDAVNGTLTQSDIISATQAAFQAWEDVPACVIGGTYMGETNERVGVDGVNNMVFYNAGLDAGVCPEANLGVDGGTLGLAIITLVAESGEIFDMDLVLDSADSWEWNAVCLFTEIQSVLTHEVGHGIGIQHPEELTWDNDNVRPTMWDTYFCNPGVAAARTLEPDDQAAAQCLYPELPTVVLMDETGSMGSGDRMGDAQDAANAFIDTFPDNMMAVAGFADPQDPCPERVGYELIENWTNDADLLHAAVNSTYACGATPLWESTCCAITKATEMAPANVIIFTDLEENTSDGDCGCLDFPDALAAAEAADVVVYAIDMKDYNGSSPSASEVVATDPQPAQRRDDGSDLSVLCEATGGLYFKVFTESQLFASRIAIQDHIIENGRERQNPPGCTPSPFRIDDVQTYDPTTCDPDSPFANTFVTVTGVVTVPRNVFDPDVQYVEDCSGGIQVFGNVGPIGREGDVVQVLGQVSQILGEIRLTSVQNYTIVGSDPVPIPSVLPPGSGQFCEMIGSLMTVRGYVDGPVVDNRFPVVADPTIPMSPVLIIYIDPDTGIDTSGIQEGDLYHVTGVLTRRLGQNELKPRGQEDLRPDATDVEDGSDGVPTVLGSGIHEVHPNPARTDAWITYQVSSPGAVRLEIVDVQGRIVQRLVDEVQIPGTHSIRWEVAETRTQSTGVYFVRFLGPDGVLDTKRVTLLK